jgi:uncharacterized Tic20 family protein
METSMQTVSSSQRTLGAATHLSALTQYVFPFGNFVLPIVIWSAARSQSEFMDREGKSVINFQLSILLYSLVMALIAIPLSLATIFKNLPLNDIRLHNLSLTDILTSESVASIATLMTIALLFAIMKAAEFFLIILGAVQSARGLEHKYPFSINFIK